VISRLTILLLLLLPFRSLISQVPNGKIAGRIYSSGKPVSMANIGLQGTAIGTVSDVNGRFNLNDIPVQQYLMVVSFIGYHKWERIITEADIIGGLELSIELSPMIHALDELVITGTRSEKKISDSAVPVSVIESRTFSATNSQYLSEGLSFSSGIRVEKDCQTCNYTQVRINGLPGSYTQLLINNRPLFSSLAGLYGLEQIPAVMIDKIEIVKGGGSVLYGSSAIAGTINIITKVPSSDYVEFVSSLNTIGLSDASFQGDLFASVVDSNLKKGCSIIFSGKRRNPWDSNGDGFSELPELKNISFGVNSFLKADENSTINISLNNINEIRNGGDQLDKKPHLRMQSEFRNSQILAANVDYKRNFYNIRSELMGYTGLQQTLRNHYTGTYGSEGYGNTRNSTIISGMQWSYTSLKFITGKNIISCGGEYQTEYVHDEIKGYNYLIEQKTFQTGLYAQSDWDIHSKVNVVAGLRASHQNTVNTLIWSPRVNLLYKISNSLKFRAGYSTGFKAPQAFETDMHMAFSGGGISFTKIDPKLQPEKSESITSSLEYNCQKSNYIYGFGISTFYTNIDNNFILEQEKSADVNTTLLRTNGKGAVVKGITLDGRFNFNSVFEGDLGFTAQQSYYKYPVKWSQQISGTRKFLRTPSVYGYFNTSWMPTKKFSIGFSGVFTGPMWVPHYAGAPGVNSDTTIKSRQFIEINLKTEYTLPFEIKKFQLSISGGVLNLFNDFQNDFDIGPSRDSNYIYGPSRPLSYFLNLKVSSSFK
jgi:outer membrane receptor for ferrienterochelin and colicins